MEINGSYNEDQCKQCLDGTQVFLFRMLTGQQLPYTWRLLNIFIFEQFNWSFCICYVCCLEKFL